MCSLTSYDPSLDVCLALDQVTSLDETGWFGGPRRWCGPHGGCCGCPPALFVRLAAGAWEAGKGVLEGSAETECLKKLNAQVSESGLKPCSINTSTSTDTTPSQHPSAMKSLTLPTVVSLSVEGVLPIFSWGDFGDQKAGGCALHQATGSDRKSTSGQWIDIFEILCQYTCWPCHACQDRINGHSMSVDAMVKLAEVGVAQAHSAHASSHTRNAHRSERVAPTLRRHGVIYQDLQYVTSLEFLTLSDLFGVSKTSATRTRISRTVTD